MSLLHLLWRNMIYRKMLSLLTVFSVAVTVALIIFLELCSAGVEHGAEKGYGPFELVIGAKGSKTQLSLNTFYHVGTPTGNIPYEIAEQLKKEDQVDAAYAMTTGDNYNGYPIVGIDPGYFNTRYGDRKLASGKLYGQLGEAVVGSYVAKTMGLKVGDTFKGGHGLVKESGHAGEEHHADGHDSAGHDAAGNNAAGQDAAGHDAAGHDEDEHDHFVYTIVGILPNLNTSDDRAVFTTLDYAWAVHNTQQGEHKDVTALMVKPKSLLGAQTIKLKYDKIDNVQAVYTSKAVADVVNMVDKGTQVISVVTVICILLAAISILLSLIAAVNERKKDVGLLRLIGKSRRFVWLVLIGEGLLLTATGLILGMVIGHIGSFLSTDALFDFSGIQIDAWTFASGEWLLITGTLIIGALASLGPALKVYRVDPLQLFRS